MDEKAKNPHNKGLLSKLSGKLALLIGSGLAILNGTPTMNAKVAAPEPIQGAASTISVQNENLPPKLMLRHTRTGEFRLAQHDSHSSHDSHASHESHASHSSHTSGGF